MKLNMAAQKRHPTPTKLVLPTKTYFCARQFYEIHIELILELNSTLENCRLLFLSLPSSGLRVWKIQVHLKVQQQKKTPMVLKCVRCNKSIPVKLVEGRNTFGDRSIKVSQESLNRCKPDMLIPTYRGVVTGSK